MDSMGEGWRLFLAIPSASLGYTSIFAVIGLLLLACIGYLGLSPMALPFAGGFMLVGPILLSGFLKLADLHLQKQQQIRVRDAVLALKRVPLPLLVLSLVCTMLFLVWITDAATLYAIMTGREYLPFVYPWLMEFRQNIVAFEFWGSLGGSIIALLVFSISAFSVPLLYQQRTNLVTAVILSVKTVFTNFVSAIFWGGVLSVFTMTSILLLPLFMITLPVLAFASYSLHNKVFPLE